MLRPWNGVVVAGVHGQTFTKNGPFTSILDTFPGQPFLTACSDDSKPYTILKALDESYKNHVGFAIIRVPGEEQ